MTVALCLCIPAAVDARNAAVRERGRPEVYLKHEVSRVICVIYNNTCFHRKNIATYWASNPSLNEGSFHTSLAANGVKSTFHIMQAYV